MFNLEGFLAGLNRLQQPRRVEMPEPVKDELTAAAILSYWGYPKIEILAMTVGEVCKVSDDMTAVAQADPSKVVTDYVAGLLVDICKRVKRVHGVREKFFQHYSTERGARGLCKALSLKGWLDFERTQGISGQESRYRHDELVKTLNISKKSCKSVA